MPGLRRSTLTRLGFALLALAACLACVRAGFWQWHKGADREGQWQRFAQGAAQVIPLGSAALASVPLYQRVSLTGTLDGAHQFLLDNRSYQERAGYEVLTPLARPGGGVVLVDRGWVPFTGSRAHLPEVSLAAGPAVTLTGRVDTLPSAGLSLGHAAPAGAWPKVTAFPSMDELAAALGSALEPRLLLLDPQAPDGYVRDWRPPGMSPLRHYSYAIQWWSFAALAVLAWGVMTVRHSRGRARP